MTVTETATSEAETLDPGQAFAALMSGAAEQADAGGPPEAPYGWTTDAVTGERRPKKSKGRPRKSPSLDELKAQRAENPPPGEPEPDRPPLAKGPKTLERPGDGKNDSGVPYHPGRIARGMAKWYRRVGRFWRIYRPATGAAFIDCADDIGEAWEEVAKGNPRIRKVLNWLVSGGNWGALFLAHTPIFAAMALEHEERARAKWDAREAQMAKNAAANGQRYQPREFREFPLMKWMAAFAEDAYDTDGEAPGGEGMTPGDMQDVMKVMGGMMSQLGFVNPADVHPSQVPPEMAQAAANGARVPQDHKPPARRAQPHRSTRAARKKTPA